MRQEQRLAKVRLENRGEVMKHIKRTVVKRDMTPDEALKEAVKRWGQGSRIRVISVTGDRGKKDWIDYYVLDWDDIERGYSNESFRDAFKDVDRRSKL